MTRGGYAPTAQPSGRGGVVACVASGSPAQLAGITVGDVITRVDGDTVADVLDWQWHTDGDAARVEVFSGGSRRDVLLSRGPGQAWGIDFADALFDGVRTCRNRCAFCFMEQLPPGLRKPLYLRDDDFRLSFLQGNFISLTNLGDADVSRIALQHLSPLYVSVHAVSPEVRKQLVCAREDRALERLDQLVEAGIELHAQVVLVPGVNDRHELEATLTWLAQREGVVSVGIVPLGYTRFQQRFTASYQAREDARAVIETVEPWQTALRGRDGVTWVYLADEFYLNAGVEVPPAEHYDGYPQFENGIGMVRALIDDAEALDGELRKTGGELARRGVSVALLTGALAAPVVGEVLRERLGRAVRVLAVKNRYFGGSVSVAGLLTGADLVDAIAADAPAHPATVYVVPDVVLNSDSITLDDRSIAEIRVATGAEVRVLSCDAAGLLAGLSALAELATHEQKE